MLLQSKPIFQNKLKTFKNKVKAFIPEANPENTAPLQVGYERSPFHKSVNCRSKRTLWLVSLERTEFVYCANMFCLDFGFGK